MIDMLAVFAGVSLLELKCKYFWSILAYLAQPTLSWLANLTFVEMALQYAEIFLNLREFVAIVDVIEIF